MLISCLFIKSGFRKVISTRQPFLQLSRGVILSINNCIVIYSFTLIGLVETHAIIACYPLIVAGLSVPFLGERFGWRRWSAIAAGFVGVIIILRPSAEIFSGGSIFALIGAILFAIYLSIIIYFYSFAPLPFVISFSGSFIVFHTLEAIVLKSLFDHKKI